MKHTSDCCNKVCFNVKDDRGICAGCGRECWAATEEGLKPVTIQKLKEAYEKKHGKPN